MADDPRMRLAGEGFFRMPRDRWGYVDWYDFRTIRDVEMDIRLAREQARRLRLLADEAEILNRDAVARHMDEALDEAYPEKEE